MCDLNIIFYLRICFMLFTSVQFSNASRVPILDPDNYFVNKATLYSLYVKEPNGDDFTQRLFAKQTILGVHRDQLTLSFYEWGASYTTFTFKQRRVEVDIFHTASITFRVKEKGGDWHFRCVFSADNNTMDILYSYLSVCTGFGPVAYRTTIWKVESYVRMGRMRNPCVQKVSDLQPASLYDQNIAEDDSLGKIFYITTYTTGLKQRRLERLVFRTGYSKVGRVNEKVVLELSGFSDCLYILNWQDLTQAQQFVAYINGTSASETLDITPDLRLYLEHGLLTVYPENESEPQSSTQPNQEHPFTLLLDSESRKHPRQDQISSRNVRGKSDDYRE